MKYTELISTLSDKHADTITKAQARSCIDAVLETIENNIMKGNRVELRGFGVFEGRLHKPYIARNPKTGQKVHVDSKLRPFFKAGKELKKRLNKEKE